MSDTYYGGGSDSLTGSISSSDFFGSLTKGVSGIAAGIGAFTSAGGYAQEANSYQTAAEIAGQNVELEKQSTRLKQYIAGRQVMATAARGNAVVAGNGMQMSGSALDILRDSLMEGHLQESMIGLQGVINENAYAQQEAAALGMAEMAKRQSSTAKGAGIGDILGGVLNIAGTAVGGPVGGAIGGALGKLFG